MALGLAAAEGNAVLDGIFKAVAYTGPATPFLKLHTGAPGSAGTTAAATNATRKALACASAAAVGGVATSTSNADMTWSSGEVTATENYTNCSMWTLSSGGSFKLSGTVTGGNVNAGDQFTIPSGNFTCTLSTAS